MLILALETSMTACSACIWDDGHSVVHDSLQMKHGHAEALAPLIDRLQKSSGIPWAAFNRIAVTTGPGSFTGLRVGLATARALSLALDIPAVGVTATRALAASVSYGQKDLGSVLTLIDTRRGDFYGELFDVTMLQSLCMPTVFSTHALFDLIRTHRKRAPIAICGDTSAFDLPDDLAPFCRIVETVTWPDPTAVARLGTQEVPSGPPTPFYIRPPNATPAAHGGQLRPG